MARITAAQRAELPDLLADGWSDARTAGRWGVSVWQVACCRRRLGLPSVTGWPCGDAELWRLVVDERLTDADIAARFGVGPRTVGSRRLALGLRRTHDPRPGARGIIVDPRGHPGGGRRRAEGTPLQIALRTLGARVLATAAGHYSLDGRRVTVVDVLRAGGVA